MTVKAGEADVLIRRRPDWLDDQQWQRVRASLLAVGWVDDLSTSSAKARRA